jgi:hypothetical protein
MRKRITIDVSDTDRQALTAIVTGRNSPQKHVWRAQIVLLTADGCGTMELTRRTGTSKTSVWRWQERFLAEGVPGLLRDKSRPSRIPPLGAEVEARVVAARLGTRLAVARARFTRAGRKPWLGLGCQKPLAFPPEAPRGSIGQTCCRGC